MMANLFYLLWIAVIALLVLVAAGALAAASANTFKDAATFYRKQFTESAEIELADLFIFTDGRKLFLLNLLALLVVPVFVHLLFQLWIVTAGTVLVLLFVPGVIWRMMKKKRLAKFEEQLPDAFMMISSSLQAGASLNMALEDVVRQSSPPLSQEFGLLIKRLKLGVNLEDALLELEKRLPLPSFVMASSAVRISREVGGNLVTTINAMAATLRRKKTMEGKIDSLTAQGRAQGTFMSLLPIGLAVVLGFLEPEAMRQLFTTRVGIVILVIMVIMQVMGFLFIKKITKIDA